MTERQDDGTTDRDTSQAQPHPPEAQTPRAAGDMGFPDSMPHVHRAPDGQTIVNERGERIPPVQEGGQAGTDDITWQAGKPVPQDRD